MAKVIKVTIGDTLTRSTHMYNSDMTLRQALESAEFDYEGKTMMLEGSTLQVGDLDKSFDDLGITGDKCYLSSVTKANNA